MKWTYLASVMIAASSWGGARGEALEQGVVACASDARKGEDRYAFPRSIGGAKDDECLRITAHQGRGDTFIVEAKSAKDTAWRELGQLFIHSRWRMAPFGGGAIFTPKKGKAESNFYVQATSTEIMILKAVKEGQVPKIVEVFNGGASKPVLLSCLADGLSSDERELCQRVIDPMKAARGELSIRDCTKELEDGYSVGVCSAVDPAKQALLRSDDLRRGKEAG